jgi:hypothetical protein
MLVWVTFGVSVESRLLPLVANNCQSRTVTPCALSLGTETPGVHKEVPVRLWERRPHLLLIACCCVSWCGRSDGRGVINRKPHKDEAGSAVANNFWKSSSQPSSFTSSCAPDMASYRC